MENLKCVLCGKEIGKNEKYDYIGEYYGKNFKFISTQKELIGKPVCLSEFYNVNSGITFYNNKKSLSFVFKGNAVLNGLLFINTKIKISSKDLKNICDIAKEYNLNPNGKEKINNLIRVEKICENEDTEYDIKELQDFLFLKWKNKTYWIEAKKEGIFNNISIYVESSNKEKFLTELKIFGAKNS